MKGYKEAVWSKREIHMIVLEWNHKYERCEASKAKILVEVCVLLNPIPGEVRVPTYFLAYRNVQITEPPNAVIWSVNPKMLLDPIPCLHISES